MRMRLWKYNKSKQQRKEKQTARKAAKICGTHSWICQRHFPIFHYKYTYIYECIPSIMHVIVCFFTWKTAVSLTLIGHRPPHPHTLPQNHVAHHEKSHIATLSGKKTQVNVAVVVGNCNRNTNSYRIHTIHSDNCTIYHYIYRATYWYNLFSFIVCQKNLLFVLGGAISLSAILEPIGNLQKM